MSTLVIVGGGPRATGVLLALVAALRENPGGHGGPAAPVGLDIHVIDPFPAGAGRVWRATQDRVLWMNSTTGEITVYATDGDVTGPAPVTGLDLATWIAGVTDRDTGPGTFIPRRDLSAYLTDALDTVRSSLDRLPGVLLTVHRALATALEGPGTGGGGRRVVLDNGDVLPADTVLLAQGHLDIQVPAAGEGHVPPGHTADTDWSHLPAGGPVIVRGLGLAFIDLMMLLTEGRGGRFLRDGAGACGAVPTYIPSGQEPVLWAGPGRGVPYRSKLATGPLPAQLRYLPAAADHAGADGTLDRRTLSLLLDAELTLAWYTELDAATVRRLVDAVVTGVPGAQETLDVAVAGLVPDPADRFDPVGHNTPLAGRQFTDRGGLEEAVVRTVSENLTRATGDRFRQDGALYGTLVAAFFALHALAGKGLVGEKDRQEFLIDRVGRDFSYTCSGPPPERLANLLALHRAGIVRFLGPRMRVSKDGDGYVASSPAVPGEIRARHLVDARLARFDATRVMDPLLRGLLMDGEVTASPAGFRVDAGDRVVSAAGEPAGDLFLVGPTSSAQVSEAFGRPGTPGRVFAANERLAAELLASVGVGERRGHGARGVGGGYVGRRCGRKSGEVSVVSR